MKIIDSNNLTTKKYITLLIYSIVLSILFYKIPDLGIFEGFDGSLRYYNNYLFANNRYGLQQSFTSFGPLLLLKWATNINNHVIINAVYNFAVMVCFCQSLFLIIEQVSLKKSNKTSIVQNGLNLIYFLIVGCIISATYLDVWLIALSIMFFYKMLLYPIRWLDIVSLLLICLGLYIKTSIAFPILIVFILFNLILLVEKKWRQLVTVTAPFISIYFIISLCIFKNILGSIIWLKVIIQMPILYSNTCNLYPSNNAIYLLFSILAITSVLLFLIKQQKWQLGLFIAAVLFTFWRYSIGRQDSSHAIAFASLIVAIGGIIFLYTKKIITPILCGVAFYFYMLNYETQFGKIQLYVAPNYNNWATTFFNLNHLLKEVDSMSQDALANVRLDVTAQEILKNKELGIFPYELTLAYKYSLKVVNRPSMQSCSFGYKAARIDSLAWQNNKPPYILWHALNANKLPLIWYPSYENKAMMNDDWPIVQFIYQHYTLLYADSFYNYIFTLKKPTITKAPAITTLSTKEIKLNTFINISKDTLLQLAHFSIHQPLLGTVFNTIYKSPKYEITYLLQNNSTITHQINESTLSENIPINKYFTDVFLHYEPVKAFKINCDTYKSCQPTITCNFIRSNLY